MYRCVVVMLAVGAAREEILTNYPHLEADDIAPVLKFAGQSDHPVLRNPRRARVPGVDAKQLSVEALRLSDEERAALAGELTQSLQSEADPDAETAWSAEIRARLDGVDAGTATTIPWSEARRRIHAAAGLVPRE